MKKRAGALNRTWLALIGLALLAAGAFWILVALGVVATWGLRGFTAHATPLSGAGTVLDQPWLAGTVLVGTVLLVLCGIWWLIAQIPRQRGAAPLQLHTDARQGTTVMPASALTHAVEQRVEDLEHVTRARAVLRGTLRSAELALRIQANERVDVPELLASVQDEVLPEIAQALDHDLASCGIEVEITRELAKRHQVELA